MICTLKVKNWTHLQYIMPLNMYNLGNHDNKDYNDLVLKLSSFILFFSDLVSGVVTTCLCFHLKNPAFVIHTYVGLQAFEPSIKNSMKRDATKSKRSAAKH